MNILDHAIEMEIEGEQYYRDLAKKAPDKGTATILKMLADAEIRHRVVLEKMKKNQEDKLDESSFRQDAKNVFAQIKEEGQLIKFDESQIDLYKKALEIEKRSVDYYLQHAESVRSEYGRMMFHKLATEEKLHVGVMETMVEMISRPEPGNWLEDAEWVHHDEY